MPKSQSASTSDTIAAIFTFLLIALLEFLAIYQLQPPASVSASGPVTGFSSGRAMEHLKVIAQRPHPTGSPENARVREYIMKQLTAIGLTPEVQTTLAVRSDPRWHGPSSAATVSNIVARLRGTGNTRALLLAAHYDSVESGPGASDDGSGTVTLLETARALKAGPPLRNDVILLITDGEELGLLGAQAFVDEHPWAKDAAVALNFEARGACGPSFMFETSPQNGWLIREFAKATPHPVTSSLMYDFYRRLPNDTDFTVFKRAGLAGLNFAYVDCWPRYHTLRDDLQDIDERSLQHDGSYALALARHFGNLNLENPVGNEAVYFSVFGATLYYPQSWVLPLTVLVLLLFTVVVALGLRRNRLAWRGIAFGFLGLLAGTAVASTVSHFSWLALRRTHFVSLLPYGMAYNSNLYALGFVALSIAILSALYVLLSRRIAVGNLTVGALLWWAILLALTSLYAPGGSYLFAWPLLFSLIELAYAFAREKLESEAASALFWTLPAIAGVLLFGSLPYLLLMVVSTSGLVTLTVAVSLLMGFLVPHLHIMTACRRWLLPGAAALGALGLIIAAILKSGFDVTHPRADSIFYALNADTGKAVWASADKTPDAWTSQFLSAQVKKSSTSGLIPIAAPLEESPAPVISAPPPDATAMDDVTMGTDRVLRLWLRSPRHARVLWVTVQGVKVIEADVNGKNLGVSGGAPSVPWGFIFTGLPDKGVVLTLEFLASQTPTLRLTDQSDGLPETPGFSFRPRPDDLMPSPSLGLDCSILVNKTFRLETRMPMMHH